MSMVAVHSKPIVKGCEGVPWSPKKSGANYGGFQLTSMQCINARGALGILLSHCLEAWWDNCGRNWILTPRVFVFRRRDRRLSWTGRTDNVKKDGTLPIYLVIFGCLSRRA